MKKKFLKTFSILIISCLITAGCATFDKNKVADLAELQKQATFDIILPDPEDLTLCPEFLALTSPGFSDLYKYGIDTSKEYYICAAKHKELAEWIVRNYKNNTKKSK